MSNYIHPLYPKLKEKASEYLKTNGFELFKEENNKRTFVNMADIYISIVNQRNGTPEVWIGKRHDKEMIQIGFILEFYLTGKTELISNHVKNNTLYNDENCFDYYSEFLNAFFEQTIRINPFPSAYYIWQKENHELIMNALIELRKKRTDNNGEHP